MCITAMSKMHAKILMFKRNFVVYLENRFSSLGKINNARLSDSMFIPKMIAFQMFAFRATVSIHASS